MKITYLLCLLLISTACLASQNETSNTTLSRYFKTGAYSAISVAQVYLCARIAHGVYKACSSPTRPRHEALQISLANGTVCCALGFGISQSCFAAVNAFRKRDKEQNKVEQQAPHNESRLKNGFFALLAGSGCLLSTAECAGAAYTLYNLTKNGRHDDESCRCLEIGLSVPAFAYCTYKTGSVCVQSLKKAFASKKAKTHEQTENSSNI